MDPDLTIVLLGNTGVGKSASGNTLLGSKKFESKRSFKSVTTEITEKIEDVCGKCISVVDTPGILTAGSESISVFCQNILQSSRVCLFLVVVKIDRFTNEQKNAVEAAIEAIGNQGLKNSYMLFTAGDILDCTIEDFIEDSEGLLPPLIERFEGRYHVFNNIEASPKQVEELLEKWKGYQTSIQHTCSQDQSRTVKEPMRIVLLGLEGAGKSASGNTILGSTKKFKSKRHLQGVTTKTDAKSGKVEGREVTVIDTPGFKRNVENVDQVSMEILKAIRESSPGPHAFVFVVKIDRVSEDDFVVMENLLTSPVFGRHAKEYSVVLFTHGDGLETPIQDMFETTCLSKLVSECSQRWFVFDNTDIGNREQVKVFLEGIDDMVAASGKPYCASEMFERLIKAVDQFQIQRFEKTKEKEERKYPTWWEQFIELIKWIISLFKFT